MLIEPDFSEVTDQVGPGIYSVRVRSVKQEEWPAKDDKPATQVLTWELETFNEADPKNNGRRIFHRTPTHGKLAFKLQSFYKALTGQELKGGFDPEMLMGNEVQVTVDKQKNNPEYTECKAFKPLK